MKDFIAISKYAGMREDLVQAGGGNTSLKLDGKRMVIKASGIQLAEISEAWGYSIVDYPMIQEYMMALIDDRQRLTEDQILGKALIEGRRPSIETFLHAVTGKVTLHTHPVAVNILAARHDGLCQLKKMFPNALTVGYATPGAELARLYYKTFLEGKVHTDKKSSIIFLKNHGVIISGSSSEEVIQSSETVNRTLEAFIGIEHVAYRTSYDIYKHFCEWGLDAEKVVVKVESKKVLDAYQSFGSVLWNYQCCPDCLVYCGKRPFRYDEYSGQKMIGDFLRKNGEPILIQWKNELFIRAVSVKKVREIESVLAFSAELAMYNRKENVDYLSDHEQDYLLNWDSEKYRQQL